jgi:hypothetical protein
MEQFDVVVIGAGAAGMMCAVEAGKRGRSRAGRRPRQAPPARRSASAAAAAATSPTPAPRPTASCRPIRGSASRPCAATPPSRLHRPGRPLQHRLAREDPRPAVLRRLGPQIIDPAAGRDGQGRGVNCAWRPHRGPGARGRRLRDDRRRPAASPRRGGGGASGGKSIPKMGATGFGYEVAARSACRSTPTRPALVPLTFETGLLQRLTPLAGVALDVRSCSRQDGLRRGHAVHPPRPVRPGHPAGLVLLARGRADHRRHGAGRRRLRRTEGGPRPERPRRHVQTALSTLAAQAPGPARRRDHGARATWPTPPTRPCAPSPKP